MKIPGLFKLLNLIAPLFILNLSVFGQNSFLKPDSKKDSAWVQQSLLNANRELITNKDTNRVIHTWVSGKVLYCSDGTLKAAQLIAAPDTFSATIQYCNHNKIFEQHFDYTDLSNYTLNSIYRLPDKAPSYLFLLSKTENQPDYEPDWLKDFNRISGSPNDMDVKHIKRLTYVAVVLRLVKDSLVEAAFPSYKTANDDNQVADSTDPADSIYTANNKAPADTSSFSFTSYIKPAGKWPKPFLK